MKAPSLFPDDTLAASALNAADAAAETAPGVPAGNQSAPATQSLYRKYRPRTFDEDELVGQQPVVTTLRNAIRLNRVAHAYLFSGPRGTGKTTTARLLAKAVNCLDPDPAHRPCNLCDHCRAIASGATTDIVEIDAASNRGIDDIRDLRERVKYAPTQLDVKFYIVDEAHQITGAAANAFLKTLEEPPAHTKFVLATTDPEELLPTIVSRCQRFDFRRISADAMRNRLRTVATAEALAVDDEALAVIARHATGSLRDALGLLEQLSLHEVASQDDAADQGHDRIITAESVRALLGVSRNDRVASLVEALADRDAADALRVVNEAIDAGEDARQLNRQLVAYLRVLLHAKAGGSADADERALAFAERFTLADLAQLARRFSETDFAIKHSTYGQLPLEVALIDGVLRDTPSAAQSATRSRRDASGRAATDNGAPPPAADQHSARPSPGTPDSPARGMPLRDRVRQPAARPQPVAGVPEPSAIREPSPTPAPAPSPAATASPVAANGQGELDVERVADLWPRIRQDVKAVNRRIEALLTSVDPVAVNGHRIVLASAYEFHRDKLNSDDVRSVVEDAIAHLVGYSVSVECQLRGDTTPVPAAPVSSAPSPSVGAIAAPPSAPEPANGTSAAAPLIAVDGDADERRLRAAKNIFDAEEIEPGVTTAPDE